MFSMTSVSIADMIMSVLWYMRWGWPCWCSRCRTLCEDLPYASSTIRHKLLPNTLEINRNRSSLTNVPFPHTQFLLTVLGSMYLAANILPDQEY